MRLKVSRVEDGLHPDQLIVSVRATDGLHFLAINQATISREDTIEIGKPVGSRPGELLIELPAETDDGTWRVWVIESDVYNYRLEAAE